MTSPAKIGRPVANPNNPAPSAIGARSSSRTPRAARRAPATCRGNSHATRTSRTPTARCNSASAPICSGGADAEAEIAHDAIADRRRGEIAKPHAEHQRPGKIDARAAAVDTALDSLRGALATGEERGRAVPAIGHGRGKKTWTDY